MKQGIYYRDELPKAYDEIDAVNISRLCFVAKSLKHYKRCPKRTTKALALGTTGHCAVLEPARFARKFVPWTRRAGDEPTIEGKKKRAKKDDDELVKDKAAPRNGAEWDAFVARNPGKQIVTLADYEAARAIQSEIWAEPESAELLEDTETEVALIWTDPETGMLCKGRIDFIKRVNGERPRPGMKFPESWRCQFGDLKTARDISPGPFFQNAAKLHYHTKLAWYADALRVILGLDSDPETLVLAVESGEIHDSVVYELDSDDLADGRAEYEPWMQAVKYATERDEWPGVGGGMRRPYIIPAWAKDDPEDELDGEIDFSKG